MNWCMHVQEPGCMTCLFVCTVCVQLTSNILPLYPTATKLVIYYNVQYVIPPQSCTNFQQKSDMFTVNRGEITRMLYTTIITIFSQHFN